MVSIRTVLSLEQQAAAAARERENQKGEIAYVWGEKGLARYLEAHPDHDPERIVVVSWKQPPPEDGVRGEV